MRFGRLLFCIGGTPDKGRGADRPAPSVASGPAIGLLSAGALLLAGVMGAHAQTRPAARDAAPRAAPAAQPPGAPQATGATPASPATPDRETEPPYEPQLMRLAEVLGALSYLSGVCRPSGDGTAPITAPAGGVDWRDRMVQLVQAEQPSPARRERLAGAFNRGFLGYAGAHHTCTAATELAAARHVEEGARLTRELASRFGS